MDMQRTHGHDCCGHDHDTLDAQSKRVDPTQTLTLRRRYERALTRRFRKVRKIVRQVVGERDALAIKPTTDHHAIALATEMSVNAAFDVDPLAPRAFEFARNKDKVKQFMRWLRKLERDEILEIIEGAEVIEAAEEAWQNIYIDTAYRKGLRDAYGRLKGKAEGLGESFLSAAFHRPVHADSVGIIYTRAFSQLNGITEAMDQTISRVLARGLMDGKGPREIARMLVSEVDRIGIVRARVLARTETINAYSEASLNLYQEAGVEKIVPEVEFTTSGGREDGVCRICLGLAKQNDGIYTLEQARGMIPVHPNCRCAWVPVVE